MTDYDEQLEAYSFPESRDVTKHYFEQYWLGSSELAKFWNPLKLKIFEASHFPFPNRVFREHYIYSASMGGVLFVKDEFELLMRLAKLSNDVHFVVIEDYDEINPPHCSGPPLRFKYPTTISWEAMNAGGYISTELLGFAHKNYFVFGDSGLWGKFAANDLEVPQFLFGYHASIADVFETVDLSLYGLG